jgi:hypothetical protein
MQTDMTKLTVAFRNFTNALKTVTFYRQINQRWKIKLHTVENKASIQKRAVGDMYKFFY